MPETIPVLLFAYARPDHLRRVLDRLRENRVPRVEVFADGAKGPADAARVAEVRAQLRAIDWCECRIVERERNMGLGRNVLAAVSDAVTRHEAFIAWEDDLVCVPGTYAWMCAGLRHYRDDRRVMSVTAWTHPRVAPAGVGDQPYFDGRAECWTWGSWARAWPGMNRSAREMMQAAATAGVAGAEFGSDLPVMAEQEKRKNIWAVRWIYHHLEERGLCLRPPWSMVEHVGFDDRATNAADDDVWSNPPLRAAPPIPVSWPEPRLHPDCAPAWQAAFPPLSWLARLRWRFGR